MSEIRVMRGQVVIREDLDAAHRQFSHIVTLRSRDGDDAKAEQRARTSHRGVVLAMGPPARTKKDVEVDPGFKVGDEVYFVWSHLEKAWTRPWPDDGLDAAWVPQQNVLAVVSNG